MRNLVLLIILFTMSHCDGQRDNFAKKIENLSKIKDMPYIPELSGDSLFWDVIKEGLDIVPNLIDKLTDTTKTDAAVPNFGGYYTVADISYHAIMEIIHGIPTTDLIKEIDTTNFDDGFWSYWNFTRSDLKNRERFKTKVENWYLLNKSKLIWVKYSNELKCSPDWKYKKGRHPAGGYYKL